MKSIELFAGAGGLAMGISAAGFRPVAVIERDGDACKTIRENQRNGVAPARHWPLIERDVKAFDYSEIRCSIDLVSGGPPCQPFSLGGKHGGYRDDRDLFPEAIRAVRSLSPSAFIFENVRGLTRPLFRNYFQYIRLQLAHPEVSRKPKEAWTDHLGRLEKLETSGKDDGLTYGVVYRVLNAADFGVPQRRERVFLVGFRSDLKLDWSFPEPTHSHEALLRSQWVTGEYWKIHKVPGTKRPKIPARFEARVASLRTQPLPLIETHAPWRTVRDAISDLPDPRDERAARLIPNHRFQPGARPYPGHTGSLPDEPAKTLKAGDHGVPGGENTLVVSESRLRYFTVRESARLQTFPDEYLLHGSWTESMRQLGNAVPVDLARAVATSVAERLRPLTRRSDGRKHAKTS